MEIRAFELDGLLEIVPRKIEDDRGYFSETFRLNEFESRAGANPFVQDNQSLSVRPRSQRGNKFK